MKKIILCIVACLIVATAALYYFMFLNRGSIEIASEDQKFTLSFSPESLPEEISSNDLSIEKLEVEELSEFEQALEPFAVYRLGPDGTEFSELLTFELTIDTQGSEFAPSLLHLAGNSVETVNDVQVSKNEDGTFTLQGTLDHFSDVVITYGFFGSEMPDDLGTHLVGEPFTVTATMKKRNVDWVSTGLEAVLEGDPEFIEPGGHFVSSKILSPHEIADQPPGGTAFDSKIMTATGTFTCLDTGYAKITYISGLFYDYNFYREGIAGLSDIFNYIFPAFLYDGQTFVEEATLRCVEPEAEELEGVLDYEVSTVCGTAETNGQVKISGTLLHNSVKSLKIRIGDKTYTPAFDTATGSFQIDEELHPGTYGFDITAFTTLDHEIMLKRYGSILVPWCPESEEEAETPNEPEDPIIYIDPTPDEPDPVADEAATCAVPKDDTCSNPAQYGFPVCDEANLPIECQATDSRPGWDCYTFEDTSCEPSTRCFCITPPENF